MSNLNHETALAEGMTAEELKTFAKPLKKYGRGYEWEIIYDHLEDRRMGGDLPEGKFPVTFQLFDDDDELYYTGVMTAALADAGERIFEPLDWAMAYAGCTDMRINGESI